MNPDKRHLLNELLSDPRESQRSATLLASGRILRARRWRRRSIQVSAVAMLLALTALSLQRVIEREPVAITAPLATSPFIEPKALTEFQSLTDEELLALFPDTPVCLATLKNGEKRLIFPRPEDAERFLGRL